LKLEELRKLFDEAREVVKEREVNLPAVTMASLLGSLYELGILTQGTVGVLARRFVPKVCAYMYEKGVVSPQKDALENLYSAFKEYGFKEGEVKFERKDGEVEIEVVTGRCKVCPKGIGGAEIKGVACPVPYFVAYCLSLMTNKLWKPKEMTRKEGDKCKASVEAAERAGVAA